MQEYLSVAITSMLPIAELRVGIPLGLTQGLDPLTVILVSVISNIIVFFPIFFGMKFFYNFLIKHWKFFEKKVEKTRAKGKIYIEKYGFIGIALFVAVPLPMTGVYTGTLAAWLLNLEWKRSFLAVSVGAIIACIIVSAISLGVLTGLEFLL